MDEKIRNIFNEIIKKGAALCVNYAVIHNNNLYKGSIGFKYNEKDSINKLFDLASLTKIICTCTIISKLIDQNRLKYDDKVVKFLKDYKYDDITIYELLTHTSGLEPDFRTKQVFPYEEAINKIYSAEKVIEKGTFLYSDVGYMLLGLIIEKIYNLPLDKVFEKEVAKPLNMNNTCFNPKDKNNCVEAEISEKRGVIKGYVHDNKAYSLNGVAGHAGVFSNIDDLINYVTMILNDGLFNNKVFLKKETIDKWYEPLVKKENYYKSFTWYTGKNPSVIMKDHAISFSGYTGPSISIDRVNKTAIIILTHRTFPSGDNEKLIDMRANIHDKIYDLLNIKE